MRRRRGITFVVTLAILAALVALVAAFSQTQQSAVREQIARSERTRARIAAEAGVQRAMAELYNVAQNANQPTQISDDWATLGQSGAERFALASSSFRVQITDLSGRLDINTATQEQLTNLGLTTEQVDSLLDWRENSQTSRAEGAKDSYYNDLSDPYNTKLGLFQTVDELLLVKGFTPDTLFSPDALYQNTTAARPSRTSDATPALAELATTIAYSPNETPTGDGRLNLNGQNVNQQQIAQRLTGSPQVAAAIVAAKNTQPNGQFARLSTVLALPGIQGNQTAMGAVLDQLNTTAATRLDGRVNVNTAPIEVLAALPGVGTDLAQSIQTRQQSSAFTKLSDLLEISTAPQFVASVADSMSVASQSFEVRVEGEAGSTHYAITATVVIENDLPRITRMGEAPFGDMPTRWNWDDVTTTTTLQEAQ